MSIPVSTSILTAQEHNPTKACTVYSVACDDNNGTYARVFCFEADALKWLAENAQGPDDNTRAELLQLVPTGDADAFWHLLERFRHDFATYRVESHELQLQPNLF